MWRSVKVVMWSVASVVALPYTVALLANILYGWPLGPRKYHRAFHPRKVLALNYALLHKLIQIRYLSLVLRWRHFYHNARQDQLVRDVPYGSSGNCVDIYLPSFYGMQSSRPVIVFIYGGTWGSGDKSMYGLLCSHLANSLSSVVLCPNYSIYPKGFVDDMVQDISDVITFIQQRAVDFGGDKNCVVLMGHSAGAHLAIMTVLELTLKQLADEPSLLTEDTSDVESRHLKVSYVTKDMAHYNVDTDETDEKVIDIDESVNEAVLTVDQSVQDTVDVIDQSLNSGVVIGQSLVIIDSSESSAVNESFVLIDNNQQSQCNAEDTESQQAESEQQTLAESQHLESYQQLTDTESQYLRHEEMVEVQRSRDILTSVQLVIGLAGVYDISQHYIYEASRGVEDVSTMARAMYGPKHFDRFSPTLIIHSLPSTARLPAIHLVHGDIDNTVPETQSRVFGETVVSHTQTVVSETVLIGCGHTDICLDLMDTRRPWHRAVHSNISRVFNQYLTIK